MKFLAMLLLAATLAAASPARPLAGQPDGSDVQIVSARFDMAHGASSMQTTQTDRDGRILSLPNPYSDGPADQYKATVVVRNTGAKAVKAVTWSVVYFDLDRQAEVKRYNVRTKKGVAAGETETLTKYVPRADHAGTVRLRASIDRIEYADGTVWRR